MLLPTIALLLLFLVVPSILSFASQTFRPNSVKRNWDSLNFLLVLSIVACGFLNRRNVESSNGIVAHVSESVSENPVQSTTPRRQWFDYSPDRTNQLESSLRYPPRTMTIDNISNVPSLKTPEAPQEHSKDHQQALAFDGTLFRNLPNIPETFIWPDEEKPSLEAGEIQVPVINLGDFLSEDPVVVKEVSKQVREACEKFGIFLLVNHGLDNQLLTNVHQLMDKFFEMPLFVKKKGQMKPGDFFGYTNSLNGRFSSKFPWKETLAFPYHDKTHSVEEYFLNVYGEGFEDFGRVYQEYSEKMIQLGLVIMELLGMSLGIDRCYFPKVFENSDSVLRLNYYPPCQMPHLTLGIGPHSDPNALTILHEDEVRGLQIYVDNEWYYVSPNPEALVINIGDTFTGLTNKRYKGCLHRAVVNIEKTRKTLSFFMSPSPDKILTPPSELVDEEHPRMYPDFTWGIQRDFVVNHYRTDMNTFTAFSKWVQDGNK